MVDDQKVEIHGFSIRIIRMKHISWLVWGVSINTLFLPSRVIINQKSVVDNVIKGIVPSDSVWAVTTPKQMISIRVSNCTIMT